MVLKPIARRRGRPSKIEGALITAQILEAGWTVITSQGYGDTSMEAVAIAAGVAKRTLYLQYPTKSALFSAVVQHRLAQWGKETFPHRIGGTLKERLGQFAELTVLQWRKPETTAITRLVFSESFRAPEIGRIFKTIVVDKTKIVLNDLIRSSPDVGSYEMTKFDRSIDAYIDMVWGWIGRDLLSESTLPLSSMIDGARQRADCLVELIGKKPG